MLKSADTESASDPPLSVRSDNADGGWPQQFALPIQVRLTRSIDVRVDDIVVVVVFRRFCLIVICSEVEVVCALDTRETAVHRNVWKTRRYREGASGVG